jgi:XTP/dITP diphosphohydrolase
MRLELASRNEHKLRELAAALPAAWELALLDAEAFPEEEGATYYENARAKARFGRMLGEFDVWMLGEDSGIEVEGLDGRPGIGSARYATGGEDPVSKLLAELDGTEGEGRRARYVCELVCLSPELEEFRGSGLLEGRIAEEPRGSGGFGYDPIFVPDGETRTVAELGDAWKRDRSHRARAAADLVDSLGEVAAEE